jgi:endonuclease/exonuclease/phosphatase family metal-dependent hydrolase
MTYNIDKGARDKDGSSRVSLVLETIHQVQPLPDLVALLEATDAANVAEIARQLRMSVHLTFRRGGPQMAWLSRPDLHVRLIEHHFGRFHRPMPGLTVMGQDVSPQFFAVHLSSGLTPKAEAKRTAQAQDICQQLEQVRNQPHVLLGDFNACSPVDGDRMPVCLPCTSIQTVLRAGYRDCYLAKHTDKLGVTARVGAIWFRRDYVFVLQRYENRILTCEVICDEGALDASDHLPVWAEWA